MTKVVWSCWISSMRHRLGCPCKGHGLPRSAFFLVATGRNNSPCCPQVARGSLSNCVPLGFSEGVWFWLYGFILLTTAIYTLGRACFPFLMRLLIASTLVYMEILSLCYFFTHFPYFWHFNVIIWKARSVKTEKNYRNSERFKFLSHIAGFRL